MKIKEFVKKHKKATLITLVVIVAYIIIAVVIPYVNMIKNSSSPIVDMEVENDNEYKQSDKIENKDFVVKVKHENGNYTKLDKDEYSISTKKPSPIGKTTSITVTYKADTSIKRIIDVKNERNKIVGFQCGYPNVKSVKAVLYSNGELCFEGNGDVLIFDNGNYPWFGYDEEDDYPITAISFQDTVTPTNMNSWFNGLSDLEYVSIIPKSVKSMVSTFQDCESLKIAGDISKCVNLTNTSSAYTGCTSLIDAKSIPENVMLANNMFEGCTELQNSADVSKAKKLFNTTEMYSGCSKLTNATIPPNAQIIQGMFEECINLQKMPGIPNTVKNMNSTFSGNKSLTQLTNIPKSVMDISSCFENCEMASGNITVDADTSEFSNVFTGAALASHVNLIGSSSKLNDYAATSEERMVLVNGNKCSVSPEDKSNIIDDDENDGVEGEW